MSTSKCASYRWGYGDGLAGKKESPHSRSHRLVTRVSSRPGAGRGDHGASEPVGLLLPGRSDRLLHLSCFIRSQANRKYYRRMCSYCHEIRIIVIV